MNFLIDMLINFLKENSYIIICIFAVLLVYFIISEIKWQKTKFKGFIDFSRRCYFKTINKSVLETLILSGAFNSFKENKKTLRLR